MRLQSLAYHYLPRTHDLTRARARVCVCVCVCVCVERGGPRARPRYPGVESEDHRATTRMETVPYLSMMLLYSRVQ